MGRGGPHLRSRDLEADACDGDRSRRQHGDDDHQHVGARRRRVAGEVEKHPQTVAVEHRNRKETTCGDGGGLGLELQLGPGADPRCSLTGLNGF